MRFAVHGPGNPVASPRSHGVPRRDVLRRVHVRVAGETAGSAPEHGLALTRVPVHLPARRAPLARVMRLNLLHPARGLSDEDIRAGGQMRLLLIGAPGAGKGTQAELLAKRFGIAHISSGDLLRQHVKDGTSLGQRIKSYVDRGDLVPDGLVMDMLRKPVVAGAEAGGYVLDGFPRTVEQAKASFPTARALGAEVQAAIHLDVAREELVRRARRRLHPPGRARHRHRTQPDWHPRRAVRGPAGDPGPPVQPGRDLPLPGQHHSRHHLDRRVLRRPHAGQRQGLAVPARRAAAVPVPRAQRMQRAHHEPGHGRRPDVADRRRGRHVGPPGTDEPTGAHSGRARRRDRRLPRLRGARAYRAQHDACRAGIDARPAAADGHADPGRHVGDAPRSA